MAKKRGRPSKFTKVLAREICLRLAEGESLRSICRDDGMPKASTVRGWVVDDLHSFSEQYARARDLGLDCMADEIVAIGDNRSGDVYLDEDGKEQVDHAVIQRDRLRSDNRKWYLSKLAPKRYGDKLEIDGKHELSGKDGAPLVPILNVTVNAESSTD